MKKIINIKIILKILTADWEDILSQYFRIKIFNVLRF